LHQPIDIGDIELLSISDDTNPPFNVKQDWRAVTMGAILGVKDFNDRNGRYAPVLSSDFSGENVTQLGFPASSFRKPLTVC
jgi:hypothetical protein